MDIQADRYVGCMLGLAVGDALGMPVEGLTARQIARTLGPVREMMPAPADHFHSGLGAGQYTDDTEETLLLAEALLEAEGFSGDLFARKLAGWGSGWTRDHRLNRGVGTATRCSVENLLAGGEWQTSGVDVPTCGSAMRVAPLGLVYHCDIDLVSRYAEVQSIPTHCGSAARAGAVAVACGVALSLAGFPRQTVVEICSSQAERVDRDLALHLRAVSSMLDLEPEKAMHIIGNSPAVYETVPAAFYFYLKFEPEEALIAAASAGGDTDSIASMAGALWGAARGSSWIPERWLKALEDRERIAGVGADLARLSARLCGLVQDGPAP
ncbi:MAG: hypothetical protein GKC10_07490 [Methanosarcinales archaeon]|nr:hypothetical protein [Methanosarcinales archaeon]